jgi:hypothetical protein
MTECDSRQGVEVESLSATYDCKEQSLSVSHKVNNPCEELNQSTLQKSASESLFEVDVVEMRQYSIADSEDDSGDERSRYIMNIDSDSSGHIKRTVSDSSDETSSTGARLLSAASSSSQQWSLTSSARRLVRGRLNTDLSLRDIRNSSQTLNDAGVSLTPLHNVPYVHGGYAAVAPMFVRDPAWMDILELLMPALHREAVLLVEEEAPPGKLMKWAEHNPVVTGEYFIHVVLPLFGLIRQGSACFSKRLVAALP